MKTLPSRIIRRNDNITTQIFSLTSNIFQPRGRKSTPHSLINQIISQPKHFQHSEWFGCFGHSAHKPPPTNPKASTDTAPKSRDTSLPQLAPLTKRTRVNAARQGLDSPTTNPKAALVAGALRGHLELGRARRSRRGGVVSHRPLVRRRDGGL